MIAQSNVAGRAATVARAFQGGGKTDWHLPSKDELTQMYLPNWMIGGIASGWYWSSSEDGDVGLPWIENFLNGLQSVGSKTIAYYVRPVRGF
jgi:hypothetical protein